VRPPPERPVSKRLAGKVFLALALLLAWADAWAGVCSLASAARGGLFDDTVNKFNGATSSWLTNANGIAGHIFWALAGIEFVWAAINWALRKHEIGDLLASVFFKILSIMFFYWLAIQYAPTWIPMLLQGFQQMATGVLGSTGATPPTVQPGMISPSAVMNVGTCIADTLLGPASNWEASGLADKVFFALFTIAEVIVVVVSYFVITLQLLMTEIEAFIVLFGGAVMLGFTGSRWTLPWGEKYFAYAVSVGVKLMVIFLVIGLGDQIITNQVNTLVSGATLTKEQYVQLMLIVLIYAGLAWNVPAMAGSFLNGSPHMSLGTMAGTAMAAGGMLAGLAAGAGSALGTAGAGTVKAGSAIKNAPSAAKSFGSAAAGKVSGSYQSLAALSQRIWGGGGDSGGTPPKPPSAPSGAPGAQPDTFGTPPDTFRPLAETFKGGGDAGGDGRGGADSDAGVGDAQASSGSGTGAETGDAGPPALPATQPGGTPPGGTPIKLGPRDQEFPEATAPENAIAGAGAAKASGLPTAEDMQKLTGAIDRLAGGQGKAPFRAHAGEYAKQKLSGAAQHLRSSDGQTGSVSIRFNHHHD
jgi:type IV secretion system protein TrbL